MGLGLVMVMLVVVVEVVVVAGDLRVVVIYCPGEEEETRTLQRGGHPRTGVLYFEVFTYEMC